MDKGIREKAIEDFRMNADLPGHPKAMRRHMPTKGLSALNITSENKIIC
jgi:hypothetical protein